MIPNSLSCHRQYLPIEGKGLQPKLSDSYIDELVKSPKTVTPMETGVQNQLKKLDTGACPEQ
jgi:hypothetical protein